MKKNNFGFTLIELMVAITIGLLMVGFGSIALNDFNEKQKIDAVKQDLLANLRLARNYATTNQLVGGATKTVVTINQNDGLMTITDNLSPVQKTFFNKDITPDGITITSPANIYFSVSDGRSVTSSSPLLVGTTAIITVVGDNGSSKVINIDESGLIYEKKDE